MAETLAPTLIGAQHIVVACEFEGDVSPSEQRSLCEQLVQKAKRYTNLPVTLATAADVGPGVNLRQQSKQLLLRVKGRASVAGNGRRSLALEVTPVRRARPVGKLTPLKSTASLVEVQGAWSIQGPIDAFEKLLGSEGRRLQRPITSDS
jgi:hypothetical protein